MKAQNDIFKPTAFYCVSQYGGYLLQLDDNNMRARIKADFNEQNDTSRPRWQAIKEDKNGVPFVTYYGKRIDLDLFLLCNY